MPLTAPCPSTRSLHHPRPATSDFRQCVPGRGGRIVRAARRGPLLPRRRLPRRPVRRAVHHRGAHHRDLLPPVLPRRHARSAANVEFLPTAGRRPAARLPRVPRVAGPTPCPARPDWNVRADLAARAMRLIGDGVVERDGVPGLATALGYSERHLNRVLTAELGAGPLALARAHRAHTARLLIETTPLGMADVAFAAGFASVRQFNDTVREVYGVAADHAAHRGRAPRRRRARDGGRAGAAAARSGRRWTPPGCWRSSRRARVDGVGDRSRTADATVARCGCRRAAATARVCDRHGSAPPDVARHARRRHAPARRPARPRPAPSPGCAGCSTSTPTRSAVDDVLGADPALAAVVAATPGRPVARHGRRGRDGAARGARPAGVGGRGPHGGVPAGRGAGRAAAGRRWHGDGPATCCSRRAGDRRRARRRRARPARADAPRADRRARRCAGRRHARARRRPRPRGPARRRSPRCPGIGPWTAGYLAMRVLGDPDELLRRRPGRAPRRTCPRLPPDLARHAARWAPWRSYAAVHLWRAATTDQESSMTTYSTLETPAGPFTAVVDADGAVLASGWTADVGTAPPAGPPVAAAGRRRGRWPTSARSPTRSRRYHDGDLAAIDDVPVRQRSGPFLEQAWEVLRTVPAGAPGDLHRVRGEGRAPGGGARGGVGAAPATRRRCSCRATGCCAPTARSADSAGAWRSSGGCWTTRPPAERENRPPTAGLSRSR